MTGRRKNHRTRDKVFFGRSGEFLFCRRAFGDRDVTSRPDEFFELRVCHGGRIHPEPIHAHAMDRLCVARRHCHFATAMAVYSGAH